MQIQLISGNPSRLVQTSIQTTKYQITVDGELIQWTGQGRMPTVFKKEVDAGKSMDSFLIPGME